MSEQTALHQRHENIPPECVYRKLLRHKSYNEILNGQLITQEFYHVFSFMYWFLRYFYCHRPLLLVLYYEFSFPLFSKMYLFIRYIFFSIPCSSQEIRQLLLLKILIFEILKMRKIKKIIYFL